MACFATVRFISMFLVYCPVHFEMGCCSSSLSLSHKTSLTWEHVGMIVWYAWSHACGLCGSLQQPTPCNTPIKPPSLWMLGSVVPATCKQHAWWMIMKSWWLGKILNVHALLSCPCSFPTPVPPLFCAWKNPLFWSPISIFFYGSRVGKRVCERQGTSKTSRKMLEVCMLVW